MKTFIKVKTQFPGLHRYENAPQEVSFLRSVHRHMFKVAVKLTVFEDDREIEFFIFQDKLNQICNQMVEKYKTNEDDVLNWSCEMMANYIFLNVADYLFETVGKKLERRFMEVEISEDGENSSIVEGLIL